MTTLLQMQSTAAAMLDMLKRNTFYFPEQTTLNSGCLKDIKPKPTTGTTDSNFVPLLVRLMALTMSLAIELTVDYKGKNVSKRLKGLAKFDGKKRDFDEVAAESLSMILEANTAKLRARYPQLFTESAAVDRDIDAENDALKKQI